MAGAIGAWSPSLTRGISCVAGMDGRVYGASGAAFRDALEPGIPLRVRGPLSREGTEGEVGTSSCMTCGTNIRRRGGLAEELCVVATGKSIGDLAEVSLMLALPRALLMIVTSCSWTAFTGSCDRRRYPGNPSSIPLRDAAIAALTSRMSRRIKAQRRTNVSRCGIEDVVAEALLRSHVRSSSCAR